MQGLRQVLLLLVALLIAAPANTGTVQAQSAEQSEPAVKIDKRKLLVQPKGERGQPTVAFLEDPVLWAREKQQSFYGQMSGAIREMKRGSMLAAAWTLVLLSFGYGVFHAAGPGHGKMVISAWLLATENDLKRGIVISAMSAVIQALTAIVAVTLILWLVSGVKAATETAANGLESASYAMIGCMGLYLIWTALTMWRGVKSANPVPPPATSHRVSDLHQFDSFTPQTANTDAATHVHGPDCGCGHSHAPDAASLRGDWSLARALSLAFAVGIRPCTGAFLVLLFANTLGLYWIGVLSTFAMAFGTFLTVSVIAAIAVYSKKLASRYAGQNDRWMQWLSFCLRLGGGGVIAGLGTILFLGSLGTSNAMM